ncbi:hypothetical protein GCM10029964_090310 [Kibdelosporangium lantanae]
MDLWVRLLAGSTVVAASGQLSVDEEVGSGSGQELVRTAMIEELGWVDGPPRAGGGCGGGCHLTARFRTAVAAVDVGAWCCWVGSRCDIPGLTGAPTGGVLGVGDTPIWFSLRR